MGFCALVAEFPGLKRLIALAIVKEVYKTRKVKGLRGLHMKQPRSEALQAPCKRWVLLVEGL